MKPSILVFTALLALAVPNISTNAQSEDASRFTAGMSHKDLSSNKGRAESQRTSNFIRRRFDENGQIIHEGNSSAARGAAEGKEAPDKIWNSYKKIMEENPAKSSFAHNNADQNSVVGSETEKPTAGTGLQMILEQYKRSHDARSQVRSMEVSKQ